MNSRKSSSLFVSAKTKNKNETICTMIIFFLSFACYTVMLPSRLKPFNDGAQSICIKQNQTHLLFTSSKRRPHFTPHPLHTHPVFLPIPHSPPLHLLTHIQGPQSVANYIIIIGTLSSPATMLGLKQNVCCAKSSMSGLLSVVAIFMA